MIQQLTLIFISLFLIQCSTAVVSQKPLCSEINWLEKGRQDGVQGQPSNSWTLASQSCQKMTHQEIQQYIDGWNHGLSMFCTESHGFVTAKAGEPYQKTCPEKYEEDFLRGYQRGLRAFLIEKENAQIIAQVENKQKILRQTPPTEDIARTSLQKEIDGLNQKKIANLKTLEEFNELMDKKSTSPL